MEHESIESEAEHNEVWQERKYLDMDEFAEWAASRAVSTEDNNIIALSSSNNHPSSIEPNEIYSKFWT